MYNLLEGSIEIYLDNFLIIIVYYLNKLCQYGIHFLIHLNGSSIFYILFNEKLKYL